MMTAKQKKAYLEDSSKCPYCKSTDISGESLEIEGNVVVQIVTCQECDNSWTDYYKLFNVEETE